MDVSNVFIFSARGKGESGATGRGEVGFLLKIQGGGFSRTGEGGVGGWEGVCKKLGGG